ncbi:DUF3592 domain-containing protein [Pseudonocardia sp.]|uniref:DUF3592 domain-containing protein n=1 Tax=Pseudonocardia sp. TaxID=60912 RepID=UPI0026269566|nr:DUF3592 domain-containing protein [Pseudonocardia sp.]
MSTGTRAFDEVAAAVRPAAAVLRRRLPELVLGLAVLVTVLAGLALAGSAIDDAAIDDDLATARAEVLDGSTFFRTLVRFTMDNGQTVVPENGVFHPRGVDPGQLVQVEYSASDPELVRVAGRSTVGGAAPLLVGVACTWVLLGPLALWLRRRR